MLAGVAIIGAIAYYYMVNGSASANGTSATGGGSVSEKAASPTTSTDSATPAAVAGIAAIAVPFPNETTNPLSQKMAGNKAAEPDTAINTGGVGVKKVQGDAAKALDDDM